MEFISKAYQALTDPTSRENFEKYGHPDGRQVGIGSIFMPGKWETIYWPSISDVTIIYFCLYIYIYLYISIVACFRSRL